MPSPPKKARIHRRCDANVPRRNNLCVSVDCCPLPRIAAPPPSLFARHFLLLTPDERPNLIALNLGAGKIDELLALILAAVRAEFRERLQDGALRRDGDVARRADGVSFNERPDNSDALDGRHFIHTEQYA